MVRLLLRTLIFAICVMMHGVFLLSDKNEICLSKTALREEEDKGEIALDDLDIQDRGLSSMDSLLAFLESSMNNQKEGQSEDECLIPSHWFYETFLTKYYPKAYVISHNYLEYMTRDELINALDDILTMLINEPVRYFVNEDEMHADVTHYWEYIIDQLAIISNFLYRCSIDAQGKIVFNRSVSYFDDDYGASFGMGLSGSYKKPLLSSLNDRQMRVIYTLYALSYDYSNKMFNEGILFSDMHQVKRYESEMQFLSNALKGSFYEVDYNESCKTSKEVAALLSQRLNCDSSCEEPSSDYPDSYYDNYGDEEWDFNDSW